MSRLLPTEMWLLEGEKISIKNRITNDNIKTERVRVVFDGGTRNIDITGNHGQNEYLTECILTRRTPVASMAAVLLIDLVKFGKKLYRVRARVCVGGGEHEDKSSVSVSRN